MIAIALLDRCLTGLPQMGRAAFRGYVNQWVTRIPLLDRCLTGGAATPEIGIAPASSLHRSSCAAIEIVAKLVSERWRLPMLPREITA